MQRPKRVWRVFRFEGTGGTRIETTSNRYLTGAQSFWGRRSRMVPLMQGRKRGISSERIALKHVVARMERVRDTGLMIRLRLHEV